MKKQLAQLLICPACLPAEAALQAEIVKEEDEDIITGTLVCTGCKTRFGIEDGVAFLDPDRERVREVANKYETDAVVASYLWSHYAELLGDGNASEAYAAWATRMQPHGGISLDVGGAVGRFTFEMSAKCDFAIGIDNSVAFIKTARRLMKERRMTFQLKDEGLLSNEVTIALPSAWKSEKVEFIVGDALRLPFGNSTVSSLSSLNLVDKVPSPLRHLHEMDRVTKDKDAQFLLSDPFSWSTDAADRDEWLGGKPDGPYAGKGLDNITRLLEEGKRAPAWRTEKPGSVWWKIRTHTNHYELIRSCFVKASR
ncbi:MAG: methyltransferase domain-containing protein [Gammaproteobacteria bacterium]|nr:methyltransferase domain-containing protein [Gammaproteobacteria bacterium]NNJ83589.1 methyltransferase domain-containing protein [Gammaproteobacteria bacterium]